MDTCSAGYGRAHGSRQAKLQEVAELLKTMLEAWRQIAAARDNEVYSPVPEVPAVVAAEAPPSVSVAYGRF